jgi:membrane-associated protease RseP (regulator of RpoE activity)
VSIGLHEIGHLVPAKLFGVKVSQYMIGFGPTLWSKRRGETEYGVKAIPLGGYISMIGMFPPVKQGAAMRTASTGFFNTLVQDARTASADTIADGEERRAFYRLPVYKRVIVMLGGPVMNLIIAVVLFAVLLMGFGVAQSSTTLASVSECVLPATSQRQSCEPGDTASPGAAAGLRPGDTILSIDGTAITSWEQASAMIRDAPGKDLAFEVKRGGDTQTLTVTPLLSERYVLDDRNAIVEDADGDPVTRQVGFIGIGPTQEVVRQPATAVLPFVGDNIARVGGILVTLPQHLMDVARSTFGGEERDPNGLISVVGVGRDRELGCGAARRQGVRAGRAARLAQHRPVRVQPHPADAPRRRARRGRALGGHPPVVREAVPPPRPGARRHGEAHAGDLRGRDPARRDERPAHLLRPREPDPVLRLTRAGFRRGRTVIVRADSPRKLSGCQQSI